MTFYRNMCIYLSQFDDIFASCVGLSAGILGKLLTIPRHPTCYTAIGWLVQYNDVVSMISIIKVTNVFVLLVYIQTA